MRPLRCFQRQPPGKPCWTVWSFRGSYMLLVDTLMTKGKVRPT